jgi:Na+/H+ antiporter NhaD/arsenite permease-like protein
MLIANDMALLTFLPLGYFVLNSTGKKKYMAFTFIMQNIAANLGGMLTPFGNPQNLYLYSFFEIPNLEFLKIMALPFVFAILLITVFCLIFVKSEPLELTEEVEKLDKKKGVLYFILFALSIAIVFRGIPYIVGLIVIPIVLLFTDRKALLQVDYSLLFTFVFFFIFSGNMARIEVVRNFFSSLLEKSTFLVSVLSCQVISNVPSAVLLSGFTNNYKSLLIAVNVGGCGTLISSMASLISFKTFTIYKPREKVKYLLINSLFSFGFLFALTAFCLILI